MYLVETDFEHGRLGTAQLKFINTHTYCIFQYFSLFNLTTKFVIYVFYGKLFEFWWSHLQIWTKVQTVECLNYITALSQVNKLPIFAGKSYWNTLSHTLSHARTHARTHTHTHPKSTMTETVPSCTTVLRSQRNFSNDCAERTDDGKAFHARAAVTGKARSPLDVLPVFLGSSWFPVNSKVEENRCRELLTRPFVRD